MSAEYKSKQGIVSRQPYELYMAFSDMRNFLQMLPEDKKQGVKADFDTIEATVQGFSIGVKVVNRSPYSRIDLEDASAPFHFRISLHFEPYEGYKTEFWIEVSAELNLMMKTLLGAKIREALDKIVDGLVAVSEGRVPEGVDPSQFKF